MKRKFHGHAEIVSALWEIASMAETLPEMKSTFPLNNEAQPPLLSGRHVIVTAGSTAEPVTAFGDALSCHAFTAQGYAIAGVMAQMGANVTLIASNTTLDIAHKNITLVRTGSVMEMLAAIQRSLPADAFIGAAGIAGFLPATLLKKLPKEENTERLFLHPCPDVLETIGTLPPAARPKAVIGFARATKGLLTHAQEKISGKNIDALIGLPPGRDRKEAFLISPSGQEILKETDKWHIGQRTAKLVIDCLGTQKTRAAAA